MTAWIVAGVLYAAGSFYNWNASKNASKKCTAMDWVWVAIWPPLYIAMAVRDTVLRSREP